MRNFSNLVWYGDQKNVEIDQTRGLSKSVLVVCLNKHKAKKYFLKTANKTSFNSKGGEVMNVGWEFSGTNICSISGSVRVSGRRRRSQQQSRLSCSPSTTAIMLWLVAISRVRYRAQI